MPTELEDLESQSHSFNNQERDLMAKLESVRNLQRHTGLRIIELRFGVKIGSSVLQHGKEYRVTAIDPETAGGGKPWVSGHRKNKDGSLGKLARRLYNNWTLVETK